MKGLMGRLMASYILLAVIILGGAGLLLNTVLSQRLAEADEAEREILLDGAARIAGMHLLFNPDRKPELIEAEIRKTYPGVRVTTVEPLTPSRAWQLSESGAFFAASYAYGKPSARVYQAPGRLLERLVQVEEGGQVRAALKVTWPDHIRMRTSALGQALLGAGLLALAAALAMALWFSRTLSAPLDRMARAAGLLAKGRWDVTLPAGGPREVGQLSEAFRAMAARLEADFQQLKGDREKLQHLTAELAHELKTPIASLRTYHELLLDGEQENPTTRQELLERGAAQVARLEYLAHFLVDMARLQARVAPLNLQESDLRDLAGQAVAAIAPVAQQRHVTVVADLPEEPVPVLADPHRIGQLLDNLLHNAVRWSPEHGRVRLAVVRGEERAVLAVEDQGPGISPDVLPRLFEPFVRGPGSEGFGLGLAVVNAVAESHGGSVAAANRPEGGARLVLHIPLCGVVRE